MIVRGVTPVAKELRTGFQHRRRRENKPGVREAITSRQMARRFRGGGLDEELDVFGSKFKIVGLFEAGHGATESEVWTDLEVLAQTTRRVGVRLFDSDSRQQRRRRAGAGRPYRQRRAIRPGGARRAGILRRSGQSRAVAIKIVGRLIAIILTIGAMFAVANTMYAAVASRAREIGTLRALGFAVARCWSRSCSNRWRCACSAALLGCLGACR